MSDKTVIVALPLEVAQAVARRRSLAADEAIIAQACVTALAAGARERLGLPWVARDRDLRREAGVITEHNSWETRRRNSSADEWAQADLMAAAPELADTLEGYLDIVGAEPLASVARKALQKAGWIGG